MQVLQKMATSALALVASSCATNEVARHEPVSPAPAVAPENPGSPSTEINTSGPQEADNALAGLVPGKLENGATANLMSPELRAKTLELSGLKPDEISKLSNTEKDILGKCVFDYLAACATREAAVKGGAPVAEITKLGESVVEAQKGLGHAHRLIALAHPEIQANTPEAKTAQAELAAQRAEREALRLEHARRAEISNSLLAGRGTHPRTPVSANTSNPQAVAPTPEVHVPASDREALGTQVEAADLRAQIAQYRAEARHSDIGVQRDGVELTRQKVELMASLREADQASFDQGMQILRDMREESRTASFAAIDQRRGIQDMLRDSINIEQDNIDRGLGRWRTAAGDSLGSLLYVAFADGPNQTYGIRGETAGLRNDALGQVRQNEQRADALWGKQVEALDQMRRGLVERMQLIRDMELAEVQGIATERR